MSEERARYEAQAETLPATLEEIEALYAASPETEYDLTLERGAIVRVRRIADVSEVIRIKKRAEGMVRAATSKTPFEAWKPFLPAEPEVIEQAYILSELLVSPQITPVKALEWAKNNAPLFAELGNKITERLFRETAEAEVEGIARAGEG